MLVSLKIKNWKSFKDEVTISMVASQQSTFSETLARSNKLRIIPIAALYGGNASGKSNLCTAIDFARNLVVKGTTKDEEIEVDPFALCKETRESPTSFTFTIIANERLYEYSFVVDRFKIHKEKLVQIRPSSKQVLFARDNEQYSISTESEELQFIAKNTRNNQLFLKNTVEQNQNVYEDIYNWFDINLFVIRPTSIFNFDIMSEQDKNWLRVFTDTLKHLDIGISRIEEEPIKEGKILEDPNTKYAIELLSNQRITMHEKDGKKQFTTMVTYHTCENGEEVKFELKKESDGTRRLLDLIPAFIEEENKYSPSVLFIDEIDRSLHHILVRRLIEYYLKSRTAKRRAQLIFSTHDLLLLDQELFRRDEMYLVERSNQGISSISSIDDFKGVRLDKNIRKMYLLGRFGGIPKI